MSYMGFLFFYPCAPSAENYFSEIYLRLVLIILLNCNRNWTEKLIINYWFLCSEASTCEAVSSNLRQEMQNRPSCRPSRILSQALPGHFLDEHLAALMGRASHLLQLALYILCINSFVLIIDFCALKPRLVRQCPRTSVKKCKIGLHVALAASYLKRFLDIS
jgi:hypothetical protein